MKADSLSAKILSTIMFKAWGFTNGSEKAAEKQMMKRSRELLWADKVDAMPFKKQTKNREQGNKGTWYRRSTLKSHTETPDFATKKV